MIFFHAAIVHCDIKSDNVFVNEHFKCKIGDMGGSRYLRQKQAGGHAASGGHTLDRGAGAVYAGAYRHMGPYRHKDRLSGTWR